MDINMDLYKSFYEVAKYKKISKAAEIMNISQPAITQSIKKLENILGLPLFYRKNNGVELTQEGNNLFEYIKDSIEKINNVENIFSQYLNLEKGQIRIGGWDTLIISLIMPVLSEFLKKYPNIEIYTVTGKTEELLQKLANGELDILVCDLPEDTLSYNNIQQIIIKNARYCFFASKEYCKKNKITEIGDSKKCHLILPNEGTVRGKILKEYCKKNKIEYLKGNYQIATIGIMKSFVTNNLGIGFTNKEDIQDLLADDKIEIIEEVEFKNIQEGIVVLKKELMNNCTWQFVQEIKKYYK